LWRRAPARECTRFVTRMTRVWRGERGISRSLAMKLAGHKTEAVYRRYVIVAQCDLREARTKLAAVRDTTPATASLGDNSVTARKERSLSG